MLQNTAKYFYMKLPRQLHISREEFAIRVVVKEHSSITSALSARTKTPTHPKHADVILE